MFYYILISLASDEKSVKILIIVSLYIRCYLWKFSIFSLYLWFKAFVMWLVIILFIFILLNLLNLQIYVFNFGEFESLFFSNILLSPSLSSISGICITCMQNFDLLIQVHKTLLNWAFLNFFIFWNNCSYMV